MINSTLAKRRYRGNIKNTRSSLFFCSLLILVTYLPNIAQAATCACTSNKTCTIGKSCCVYEANYKGSGPASATGTCINSMGSPYCSVGSFTYCTN